MGREVRRVPSNWEHPKNEQGQYIGLCSRDLLSYWDEEDGENTPDMNSFMPDWPKEEMTHYQMYETTSEGTPISPVFADPESLARWLVENDASAFGNMTQTYEWWLRIAKEDTTSVGLMIEFDGHGRVVKKEPG